MNRRDRFGRLLDPTTCVRLDDVGLPGYQIGESIAPDGTRELWIVDLDGLGVDGTDHGAIEPPAHEKARGLPRELRALFAKRCGRPRKDGQPCRSIVAHRGAACPAHRPPPRSGFSTPIGRHGEFQSPNPHPPTDNPNGAP